MMKLKVQYQNLYATATLTFHGWTKRRRVSEIGLADSPFDRDLYDHNADYISRFAHVWPQIGNLPGSPLVPGKVDPITINGLTITVELAVRLRRVTQKNTVKDGGMMLRYAKNKPLSPAVGAWQSAFIWVSPRHDRFEASTPEAKLCLTLDAWGGKLYQAPTDSVSRFNNMKAACATIAERWDNIQPPQTRCIALSSAFTLRAREAILPSPLKSQRYSDLNDRFQRWRKGKG